MTTRTNAPFIRTSEAKSAGEASSVRTRRITGSLVRVRRDVHLDATVWTTLDVWEKYLVGIRAVSETRASPVFCWKSAAAIHGLALLGRPPEEVFVLAPTPASGGRRRAGVVECRQPPDVDVVTIGGVLVTSIAQTVVDLARRLEFRDAVVIADSALASKAPDGTPRVTRDQLIEVCERHPSLVGTAKARLAIAFADARTGSALESISRVGMHQARLPVPDLQREFHDRDGFAGQVDFYFEEEDVIGEADGDGKLVDPDKLNGRSSRTAILEEKAREDRLRALGPRFARWGWAQAFRPAGMLARLAAAGVHPRR